MPAGVNDNMEAIGLKLGDEEKVCNPALVNEHFKYSKATFHRVRCDTWITVSTDNLPWVADLCQVVFTYYTMVRGHTVRIQFGFI